MQDAHVARTADPVVIPGLDEAMRTARAASPERAGAGPLAIGGDARMFTAHLFNALIAERWENEEAWASNRNIADRFCRNTESVVRRWRDGEKLVPLAILRVLPAAFAEQLARRMVVDRGVGVRRPMAMLREAVERLAAPVAAEDRAEALRGLIDARDRLIKRIDRLAGEGK